MATIILILALIVIIAGFALPREGEYGSLAGTKRAAKVVGFALVALSLVWASYRSVPAGSRGVLLQFGAVRGVMGEGAHFIVPFVQKVTLMEVRTQKEEAKASAASRDLQIVQTNVAINFHVDPASVGELFKRVGPDYARRIIDPATQETVKAVVANYTAEELVRLRGDVKAKIDEGLTARLAKYHLVVESGGVSLTNFDFSEEYNKAIERKQVAQQTAEQQKYELQRAELAAKTEVAAAKGKAEAARIEAEALNTQGGAKVLAKIFLEKWDGKLPVFTGGGNSDMIIDIRSLMEAGKQ